MPYVNWEVIIIIYFEIFKWDQLMLLKIETSIQNIPKTFMGIGLLLVVKQQKVEVWAS